MSSRGHIPGGFPLWTAGCSSDPETPPLESVSTTKKNSASASRNWCKEPNISFIYMQYSFLALCKDKGWYQGQCDVPPYTTASWPISGCRRDSTSVLNILIVLKNWLFKQCYRLMLTVFRFGGHVLPRSCRWCWCSCGSCPAWSGFSTRGWQLWRGSQTPPPQPPTGRTRSLQGPGSTTGSQNTVCASVHSIQDMREHAYCSVVFSLNCTIIVSVE